MKYSIFFLCIILDGCAQNSGVTPTGGVTYMITHQDAIGVKSIRKIKAEAIREANEKCKGY
ncbi:hypothetical protein [Pseudoalteromonas denitrificans]|jgi:hypothetical protein|uniref:Uncharacterized protein n=1 Tax=Pseudoalteromonas denitrificans DSM 6059 TaxID=1123010 RepID=A0A1I1TNF2_9GAMM|nr:hypothetical protein [Pseudoalteromonas denitrificans]SFD60152.1 hypothetical protein SAMN02745724_04943 [Pseudoalteromonas denitrificans DSM 6059]